MPPAPLPLPPLPPPPPNEVDEPSKPGEVEWRLARTEFLNNLIESGVRLLNDTLSVGRTRRRLAAVLGDKERGDESTADNAGDNEDADG